MKRVFFILLFFAVNCFAQSQRANIVVEYQMFFDTKIPFKHHATLSANYEQSIFQDKYSTNEDWAGKESKFPEGTFILGGSKSDYDPYIKIDLKNKEMFFFDRILKNNFLVQDVFTQPQWKITNEIKDISGFQCVKATTTFRGRDWTAWFSPQIALPFGPWKLHGLPGLILYAHDKENIYTMQAVKVEYVNAEVLNKNFGSLMETKNTNPLAYKEFLSDREEAIENAHNKVASNYNGTRTKMSVPRTGIELKYGWEE